MNRAVLIVTPFFPPQSHAAVFRAYKLAKYLPRYGWTPHVLTVDTNYSYNEDRELLAALSPEVRVHRARYIEPSLRGLRMLLGGRDRTFASVKASTPSVCQDSSAGDWMRGVYKYISDRWLRNPDEYWTWSRPAIRLGKRLIREHNIPIVYTSAPPSTCLLTGLALQGAGCKLLVDFRDPYTYTARGSSALPPVYRRQRAAEGAAARRADVITVASSAIGMILTDMFGADLSRRIHFIPTGLDQELLTSSTSRIEKRSYPYLLISGEFLAAYGTEFLELFARSLQHPDLAASRCKLLFVGRKEVNEPLVLPIARYLGIEHRVEFLDHMPQRDLYSLVNGALAGVLICSRWYPWWCLHAKLVDYLALNKTVIALVPDPSEARTRLRDTGLGVFLDGDTHACVQKLVGFLTGSVPPPTGKDEECRRYTALNQVEGFVEILEGLAKAH